MRRRPPEKSIPFGIAVLLLASLSVAAAAGCLRGAPQRTGAPVPPKEEIRPPARDTAIAVDTAPQPGGRAEVPAPPVAVSEPSPGGAPPEAREAGGTDDAVLPVLPEEKAPAEPPAVAGPAGNAEPEKTLPKEAPRAATIPKTGSQPETARKGKPPQPGAIPAPSAYLAGVPAWTLGKEELVYRVEFLGLTMGYARFAYKGTAIYDGKVVYHVNVRAWTSDALSILFPLNDSIDYYLDGNTLAPLRQEYTRIGKKGKDDIAYYDQKNGRIVYRYRHNGEVRKEVDAMPEVHDPVTAAYYFRVKDLGEEGRPRNVYSGRKLWQISTRAIGTEKIDTPGGPVETVVIRPIIKREGKMEDKGDLKLWMTKDARHVPVRIYAKFKKIRMWTLMAELMPAREGG